MVIPQDKIEHINQLVLSKGNVFDSRTQSEMSMFLYGNTTVALTYMCNVLAKFDLNIKDAPTKDDFVDSSIYYRKQNKSQTLDTNVSVKLMTSNDKVVAVEFRVLAKDIIKKISDINPISISQHNIVVHLTDAQAVLSQFRNLKMNVANVVKFMKGNGVTQRYFTNTKDLTPEGYVPNKIVLVKENAEMIRVIADEIFSQIISDTRGYKWVKASKKHLVPKNQLFTLYSKIQQHATNINFKVDVSDFDNYLNLSAGLTDTPIVCQTCETVTFMQLPIHPVINNALITIPTMVFNEPNLTYIFKTRHLQEVYDKLVETQLKLDLQPILDCIQKNALTKQQQTVNLIDYRMLGISRKPWKHQIDGATQMLRHRKMILADEMGTGKTFTAILAGTSIINQLNRRALIICPSSVKYNWKDEIQELDKKNYIHVVEGSSDFIPPYAKWVIINYDVVGSYIQDINANMPACLIVDEAHRIKAIDNHGLPATNRAKNCLVISGQIPYVFPLTGTPTLKGNIDLFNLLSMIDCPLSDNFPDYGFTYCDGKVAKTGGGYDFSGSSNEIKLNAELKNYMIRHRKSECLDLPKKMRTFMRTDSVDLTQYRQAVDDYMNERQFNSSVINLVLVGQMKKFLAYAKVVETVKLARDLLANGDAVVIFSDYTYCIQMIVSQLSNYNVGTITGKDNSKTKLQRCKDFNQGKLDALVCNIKAGGEGLNMTRANKMIINDLTWVPAMLFQVEDRIHRGGQKRKVEIIYPIAEEAEIDIKLAEIIEKRAKSASQVVDGLITQDKNINVIKSVLQYVEDVKSNKRTHGFAVDTDSYNLEYEAKAKDGTTYKGKAVYYAPIDSVINISIPQKLSKHSRFKYIEKLLQDIPNQEACMDVQMYHINQQTGVPEFIDTVNLDLKTGKPFVEPSENDMELELDLDTDLESDNEVDSSCYYVFPHGETMYVNEINQSLLDDYRLYKALIDALSQKVLVDGNNNLNLNTLTTANGSNAFKLSDGTQMNLADKHISRLQVGRFIYNFLKSEKHMQYLNSNLIVEATVKFPDGKIYSLEPTEDDSQFRVLNLDPSSITRPDVLDNAISRLDGSVFDDLELEDETDFSELELDATQQIEQEPEQDNVQINKPFVVSNKPYIIEYDFMNAHYKEDLLLQLKFEKIANTDNFSLAMLILSKNRSGVITKCSGWTITKLGQTVDQQDELGKEICTYLRRIEKEIKKHNIATANSISKHLKMFLEGKM